MMKRFLKALIEYVLGSSEKDREVLYEEVQQGKISKDNAERILGRKI